MSLARCKNRPECKSWTCYHYGTYGGLHEANDGCTRYRDCETECEPVAVVPAAALKGVVAVMCGDCGWHHDDECEGVIGCDETRILRAAIAEAEEESHGADS